MGFDSYIDEFDNADENKISTTPAIVTETIEVGTTLINKDYLPTIEGIKDLKPYIGKFKSMNLYDMGWRFQFGSSKQWAGLCASSISADENAKSKYRNIFVSIQYTKHDLNWKHNMESVILHEIAHAIVSEIFYFNPQLTNAELNRIDDQHLPTKGHGRIWKEVCHAVSGTEYDCSIMYKNSNLKDSIKNFVYNCPNCEHIGYGNSILFTKRCEKCDKSVIVEPNIN